MKKGYLLKEVGVFISLFFIFFFFELVGWSRSVQEWSSEQLIGVYRYQVRVVSGLRQPYEFLVFLLNKYQYTKQLEIKYVQTQAELSKLSSLRREVTEYRKIVERSGSEAVVTTPIISLAYPAVGVGSRDGIQEKAMVLSSGVLVGTVYDVGESIAKVSLLTQARKERVLAETESGVQGVIEGTGNGLLFTQVSRGDKLKASERVVTVGQEGIARGTYVGVIRLLDDNPANLTQTAVIDQGVSFYSSLLVEIK